jgi:hypothetical protein
MKTVPTGYCTGLKNGAFCINVETVILAAFLMAVAACS